VYEPVFVKIGLAERVAFVKSKFDKKAPKKKGDMEVTKMPAEPKVSKDSKVKKDQVLWEKYAADTKSYRAYALGKARRADLTEGAEVTYPEDLQDMRPMSEKTGKPLRVIITKAPKDPSKALWPDEFQQTTVQPIDTKVRKDKTVMPKLKGLSDKCFAACKDDLLAKLIVLSKSDAAIWEGCKAAPKKPPKKGEPKEPTPPKDLLDPTQMFKEGKNAGKYEDFDTDGIPRKKVTKKGGVDLKDAELKPLRKEWEKVKGVWDKHQAALATYKEEMKKLNPDLETGEDDFGIPLDQKEESCKTAANSLVAKLVEDIIVKKGEELAAAIDKGEHDTAELKDIVVQETFEEVEIITDPVLKAFRRVDQEATNVCSADQWKVFMKALGDDELQQGTHKFYSEASDAELDWVRGQLGQAGVEQDGNMEYTAIKNFIEAEDIAVAAGNPPTNSVSCQLSMKIENCLAGVKKMDSIWSPRTWRTKLGEEFGSPGGAGSARGSPKGDRKSMRKTDSAKGSPKGVADSGEIQSPKSGSGRKSVVRKSKPAASEEFDKSPKKEKDEKKEKKEDKDKKEKRTSTRKSKG